jgi:hypothetical protein
MKIKRLIFLATIFIFFLGKVCPAKLDLDREFTQLINEQTAFQLLDHPGRERPIFIGPAATGKVRVIAGLRYDKQSNRFILRGNLPEDLEASLKLEQRNLKSGLFSPAKKNGEPLYRYGTTLSPQSADMPQPDFAKWFYVPHHVNGEPNKCFVCDLGYFEFSFAAAPAQIASRLNFLIAEFSQNRLKICKKVPLNRYFLFKDNFWGPVDYFAADSIAEAMELATINPSHKLTLNKHLKDWRSKSAEDIRLVFELLDREEYLLSQDYRLKLGLVPDFVRINFSRIDNTDIGSGQNQMVFLSIGPGINYFDDPWQQPRRNLPCPRIIFNVPLLAQMQIQLFPTYSVEPKGSGESRLQAINAFQKLFPPSISSGDRLPVWAGQKSRKTSIAAIENALCSYGLLNDSAELSPGFFLEGKNYNGNIVNNEVRMANGLSLRSFLAAIIVPPQTLTEYQHNFIRHFYNRTPHWQFIAGTHFKDLFIAATTADDLGFRLAFLFRQLQFSHPLLARIIKKSRAENRPQAEKKIAAAIDRLIQRYQTQFFATPIARHRRRLEAEKLNLWCEYLESFRLNKSDTHLKLQRFIHFHDYLKEILQ